MKDYFSKFPEIAEHLFSLNINGKIVLDTTEYFRPELEEAGKFEDADIQKFVKFVKNLVIQVTIYHLGKNQ